MQTRSAARKSAALAQASQAPSTPPTKEESHESLVIHSWAQNGDDDGNMEGIVVPPPPKFTPIPTNERSLDSLFYGSLSSIASSSSGGGSFSSVDDSSPHASFTVSPEAAGGLLSFLAQNPDPDAIPATPLRRTSGPTRVARGGSKRRLAKRPYPVAGALTSSSSASSSSSLLAGSQTRASPLKRDAAINFNWHSDPIYGASPMITGDGRHQQRARTADASFSSDPDDIFQREMQLLLQSKQNKELALAGVLMSTPAKGGKKQGKRPPHSTPARTPARFKPKPKPSRRPLGPEGTELIDDSFRAAPAGPSVYPEDWVAHPSNILHAHPTLQLIDDDDAMVH